jgi:hypothetical protein
MPILSLDDIARFEADGALLLRGAIPAEQVAAMRELIWSRLSAQGIRQDEPSTWSSVNNEPLRRIRRHHLFAAIDSPRLHGAIDDLVGAGRWDVPENWGMFRITPPVPGEAWQPTPHGWHSDCLPWQDPRLALFVLTHIGATVPGGGGTLLLAGSHRRLARIAERCAGRQVTRRKLKAIIHDGSPWLSQMMGLAPTDRPRSTFMSEPSPADEHGVRMRVIEACGEPGDVWLCHATIYHAVNDNRSASMRMMRLRMIKFREGLSRDDPDSDAPLARSVRPQLAPS